MKDGSKQYLSRNNAKSLASFVSAQKNDIIKRMIG